MLSFFKYILYQERCEFAFYFKVYTMKNKLTIYSPPLLLLYFLCIDFDIVKLNFYVTFVVKETVLQKYYFVEYLSQWQSNLLTPVQPVHLLSANANLVAKAA